MELVIILAVVAVVLVGLTAGGVTLARRNRPRPVPRAPGRTTTLRAPDRPRPPGDAEEPTAAGDVAVVEPARPVAEAEAADLATAPPVDEPEVDDLDAELELLLEEAPPAVRPSFRDR